MRVKVRYRAHLDKCVAADYEQVHNGHHFWCIGVNSVLQTSNKPLAIDVDEVMDIGFFADVHVTVEDPDTGASKRYAIDDVPTHVDIPRSALLFCKCCYV